MFKKLFLNILCWQENNEITFGSHNRLNKTKPTAFFTFHTTNEIKRGLHCNSYSIFTETSCNLYKIYSLAMVEWIISQFRFFFPQFIYYFFEVQNSDNFAKYTRKRHWINGWLCKFRTHTSRVELHIFAAGASKFHTCTASQSQAAQCSNLIATVLSDEDAVVQPLEGPAPQPAPSQTFTSWMFPQAS